MLLMKNTKAGTIAAFTWDNAGSYWEDATQAGITLGLYGDVPVVSVECQGDELVLLVNDDAIELSGFKVVHTKMDWQEKEW